MELQRGTFNSISRFSEDDPPHITTQFQKKAYPQLKRKLFEAELDADDLVQVCLRIKPSNVPNHLYEIRDDQSLITYGDTTTAGHGRRTQNNVSKMYKFSHIFGTEASQKEIFDLIVKNNLQKLADGQSYTLLTYGASGSGKTYTLMGTESEPGLVPRSLEYIFKVVDAAQYPLFKPMDGQSDKLGTEEQNREIEKVKKLRQVSAPVRDKYKRMSIRLSKDFTQSTLDLTKKTTYYVWVSFVEIYNESIYDLLVPGDRRATSKLIIREDSTGHVYVKGARQAFVRSGSEAYDVMAVGRHNLQVAATGVHANSSRSHCIFTITMLADTPEGVRTSCVRLCDLAGSERAKSTRNTGARMAESRAINSSLHVLERCLHARRQQRPDARVPYRESKLTRLLGAGLSGGEPVTMLVTVNPSPMYIHETRHVLQLAAVARDIQINNTVFESTSSTINSSEDLSVSNEEIMKLRAENERLHYELVQLMESHKELQNQIEEERLRHAKDSKGIVQEVKDMSRQYYEAHILSLTQHHKAEMEELLRELQQVKNTKVNCNMEQLLQVILHLENNMKNENMIEIKKSVLQLRQIVTDSDNNKEGDDDDIQFLNVDENNLSKSNVSEGKRDESRNYIRETCSILSSPLRISTSTIGNNDSRYDSDTDKIASNSAEKYLSKINESIENKIDESIGNKIDESIKINVDESVADECDNNYESDKELVYSDEESNVSSNSEVLPVYEESIECKIDTKSPLSNPEEIKNDDRKKSNDEEKSNDEVCLILDSNKVNSPISLTNNNMIVDNDAVISEKLSKISKENVSFMKSKNLCIDGMIECKIDTKSPLSNPEEIKNDDRKKSNDEKSNDKVCLILDSNKVNSPISLTNNNMIVDNDAVISEKLSKISEENVSFTKSKNLSIDANLTNISSIRDSKDGSLMLFENAEEAVGVELNKQNYDANLSYNMSNVRDSNFENGSLMSFENVEEAVNKEVALEEKKTRNRSSYFKFTKKDISYFPNLNDNVKVKDKPITPKTNSRSPSINNDDTPIVQCNTVIKKILTVKEHSTDVFDELFSPREDTNIDTLENNNKLEMQIIEVNKSSEKLTLVSDYKKNKKYFSLSDDSGVADNITKENLSHDSDVSEIKSSDSNATKQENTIEQFDNIYKEKKLINKCDEKYDVNKETITNKPNNTEEEKKKKRSKRALRSRRCKNIQDGEENDNKIKDLQKEFSDVTLDKPVVNKIVPDIPSPEICVGDEENVPPPLELMSCPSKSVLRSRRKLFTPRAEPLDQSPDSGGRPRVPRPSYCRARRRLQ